MELKKLDVLNKPYKIYADFIESEAIDQFVSAMSQPCTDCGVPYPYYVMDWDHIKDKKFNVSRMGSLGSEKLILEEIAKCELVCSNCHRERTHKRKTGASSNGKNTSS